jgi:hypothetical protein
MSFAVVVDFVEKGWSPISGEGAVEGERSGGFVYYARI